MLIGELSKRTGVSRDTIRYYEKLELLVAENRNSENDYKIYGEAAFDRLRHVQRLKEVGFTLREVHHLLCEGTKQQPCKDLPLLLTQKLETIDKQVAILQSYKASLLGVRSTCDGDCETSNGLPICIAQPRPKSRAAPTAKCC
jgi:DNA-binding transcriptional MerR regulator